MEDSTIWNMKFYKGKSSLVKANIQKKMVDQTLIKVVWKVKNSRESTFIHNKKLKNAPNKEISNTVSKTLNVREGVRMLLNFSGQELYYIKS